MARSLIPDPLEMLRQAVNRLEGKANTLAGRGLEIDQVVRGLHQLSSLSMGLRQVVEAALEGAYRRLNLPTGREFAEMSATLQRLEDKLDSLLTAQNAATPTAGPARPSRTRKPAAEAAAPAVAPRKKAAAPKRRRAAP